MPLPDSVWERLRGALIATDQATDDGRPVLKVTSVGTVPGSGASDLGKAEDAVHASGDIGVEMLAVRANTAAATGANGDYVALLEDANGGLWVSLVTKIAGEDLTVDRLLVAPKYSYSAVSMVDHQVKAGAGILHSVTFAPNDVLSTAGSIIIYDSLTETGTVMFNWFVPAAIFSPFTVVLDYAFATGCYVGFTTTGDVNVSCAYL